MNFYFDIKICPVIRPQGFFTKKNSFDKKAT